MLERIPCVPGGTSSETGAGRFWISESRTRDRHPWLDLTRLSSKFLNDTTKCKDIETTTTSKTDFTEEREKGRGKREASGGNG